MPRFSSIAASWLAVTASLALSVACSKGDGRESFAGEAIKSTGGDEGAGTDAGGAGTDGDDIGGTAGATDQPLALTSKTLEQCTAEKKAWIAVVDSGSSPSVCGDTLVDYCCVENEIAARFPSKSAEITTRFADITAQSYVLYHCSSAAAGNKSTFHFAKIAGGSTYYKTVFVTDLIPADQGAGITECPTPTTADLKVEGATAELDFVTDIVPVLAASCAGAACHNPGNTAGALAFDGEESTFKAIDKTRIENDEMPPTPATLSAADKAKLLDFLAQ